LKYVWSQFQVPPAGARPATGEKTYPAAGIVRRTLQEEGRIMKMAEIKTVAKAKGLNAFGKTKEALIREVQKAERNRDCFNRGESAHCGQARCAWRTDCK
jgi:hypothetical protein